MKLSIKVIEMKIIKFIKRTNNKNKNYQIHIEMLLI